MSQRRNPTDEEYIARIEGRAGFKDADWTRLWPIAAAPVLPLIALAFKKQPRVRNTLAAVFGASMLVYAHHAAITTSGDVSGK